jgi:hypothetical protein
VSLAQSPEPPDLEPPNFDPPDLEPLPRGARFSVVRRRLSSRRPAISALPLERGAGR